MYIELITRQESSGLGDDGGDANESAAPAQPGGQKPSDEGGSGEQKTVPRQGLPGSYFREKPVKLGEELDVTISELSKRGDGVARIQGYVIFVPKCQQGQQVRIKITTIRPNYAVGELVQGSGTTP